MAQLSLVALYGSKPENLTKVIIQCQQKVAAIPGIQFHPYDIRQVHATLISLERLEDSAMHNLFMFEYRNQLATMDFDGLFSSLRSDKWFPFQVQIAGFKDRDTHFTSRGDSPYKRSFSIQEDKVMVTGWPVLAETIDQAAPGYKNVLDEMRKAFQAFNILHRYHRDSVDMDNDFYFRIGLIEPASLTSSVQGALEEALRVYLSDLAAVIIEVNLANVFIARYEDNTLPLDSTSVWPLSDPQLTGDFIRTLYE